MTLRHVKTESRLTVKEQLGGYFFALSGGESAVRRIQQGNSFSAYTTAYAKKFACQLPSCETSFTVVI